MGLEAVTTIGFKVLIRPNPGQPCVNGLTEGDSIEIR